MAGLKQGIGIVLWQGVLLVLAAGMGLLSVPQSWSADKTKEPAPQMSSGDGPAVNAIDGSVPLDPVVAPIRRRRARPFKPWLQAVPLPQKMLRGPQGSRRANALIDKAVAGRADLSQPP